MNVHKSMSNQIKTMRMWCTNKVDGDRPFQLTNVSFSSSDALQVIWIMGHLADRAIHTSLAYKNLTH